MTRTQLVRRSLFFHWRGNLAVLFGVAVGTAVLTGALLVGDSLRGSLRDRALNRLGWVEQALVSGRFIRAQIAQDLSDRYVERGITLRATAEAKDHRANGLTIWTTRADLPFASLNPGMKLDLAGHGILTQIKQWFGLEPPSMRLVWKMPSQIAPGAAWIPATLATSLDVKVGDSITFIVGKPGDIPRESLLGRRSTSDTTERLSVRIDGLLDSDDPAAEFSLAPDVTPPTNVFVSLPWLQEKLGQPDRINVLLANGYPAATLQERLRGLLRLDDWGLILRTPRSRTDALFSALDRNKDGRIQPGEWRGRLAEAVVESIGGVSDRPLERSAVLAYFQKRGSFDLESRQMLIEPAVERAALAAARECGLRSSESLVYLANGISDGKATIPYSIVAAVAPEPAAFGQPLGEDEIVLVDWKESPLQAKAGDAITVSFFEPELEGRIRETTKSFRLRGLVPLTGAFADPDLTPEFPGITDKLDLREWDPPFPYDPKRIQRRDDDYWAKYRTTPKAYISLAAARKHFGSRFGQSTSIRLFPGNDARQLDDTDETKFRDALLAKLDLAAGGFVFDDVRSRALTASTGGQDFGMLFVGFSFFLIAAALVLIGLLVRLNLDRRAEEIGLLFAVGYSARQVRGLMIREGLIVATLGTVIGIALAIGYAALMIRLLAALWPDGSIGSFLRLHVSGTSLLIGAASAFVVSVLAMIWGLRVLRRWTPSALLAGAQEAGIESPRRWSRVVMITGLIGAVVLLVAGNFVHQTEARAGCFFGGGAMLLIAALAAVSRWLKRPDRAGIAPGPAAMYQLGARNTSRNPTRSLLTAGLLAAAAFLLVAVESFRRSPERDFLSKSGGSGGFPLLAECDLPLYQDPSSVEGRLELLDRLEQRWREGGASPADIKSRLAEAKLMLDAATILPLRRQAGDDASCLNLYQPGRPRVVGVPPALISRGGFAFAGHEGQSAEDRGNPWRLLDSRPDDDAIPAIGEANTVMWMLKSGLGGTIAMTDGDGRQVKLRIVALLHDSVFQGELVVSDAAFRRLYPRQEGFTALLIDLAGHDSAVRGLLETGFADRGLSVVVAADKLRGYHAVENTYLSTFQILGGFGLMLGTLGLAAVLLRNVWERRREFALLRAVGYSGSTLGRLVFVESAVLLMLGLGAGTIAALIAVAPQWITGAGSLPGWRLPGLILLVVLSGFAASAVAVRSTVRAQLIPSLRRE